jgi:DNA-directed RNA polymerase specialized sigma24 family protein
MELENMPIAGGAPEVELLAAHDPRNAELVKLRYFVGLTLEETAAVLDLSERTAKRDWAYARVWLYREISRRKD